MSSAAVALNLSAFYAKLATIVDESVGTTHCDIDESPSGNSRSAWDFERVSNRTLVKRRTRELLCVGLLSHVNSIAILVPFGLRLRRNVLTSRTRRIQTRRWDSVITRREGGPRMHQPIYNGVTTTPETPRVSLSRFGVLEIGSKWLQLVDICQRIS